MSRRNPSYFDSEIQTTPRSMSTAKFTELIVPVIRGEIPSKQTTDWDFQRLVTSINIFGKSKALKDTKKTTGWWLAEFCERSIWHGEPWQTNCVGSGPKDDCGDATGALGEAESAAEERRIGTMSCIRHWQLRSWRCTCCSFSGSYLAPRSRGVVGCCAGCTLAPWCGAS